MKPPTKAIFESREGNLAVLPKGDLTIARQFTAGFGSQLHLVPEGTAESFASSIEVQPFRSELARPWSLSPALKRRAIFNQFLRNKCSLMILLFFVATEIAVVKLQANDVAAAFEQANRLYEQNKYSEAAGAYQKLVEARRVSAPLYFNLGNALFKSGQVGKAIISYRFAQTLAPRDPDIKANLRFARDTVQGGPGLSRNRWAELVKTLTLGELTMITVLTFWIWMSLLIVRELRMSLQTALSSYTRAAGVVTLVFAGWLMASHYAHFEAESAVVVAPEAAVRYGPLEESQSFYTLRDGAEVAVIGRKASWLQVKDASQRVGWVQSKQVGLLPPG